VVKIARARSLLPPRSSAAIDATGFETRHISLYFQRRGGVDIDVVRFPKLTVVCDLASHFWLSAEVSKGPSHDARQFVPAVTLAAQHHPIGRLLGDKAYDSEQFIGSAARSWESSRRSSRLDRFRMGLVGGR
jgi:hypothetical protein